MSGDTSGTIIKETRYRTNDALLYLMLFRIYFVILALWSVSPVEKLYSRRVYH